MELKDWILLFIGVVLGVLAGTAIYWLRLGQFCNELRSLSSLMLRRFNSGATVKIKKGSDLRPVDSKEKIKKLVLIS